MKIKINEQRISFSKKIKRQILLDVARGYDENETFLRHTQVLLSEITSDKKYVSKILHKWRKELYADREYLKINSYGVDKIMLQDEIKNMGKDEEFDEVQEVAIRKYKLKIAQERAKRRN